MIVEARNSELKGQQDFMPEEDRRAVCKKLAKFLKDAKNHEAKQYIPFGGKMLELVFGSTEFEKV